MKNGDKIVTFSIVKKKKSHLKKSSAIKKDICDFFFFNCSPVWLGFPLKVGFHGAVHKMMMLKILSVTR